MNETGEGQGGWLAPEPEQPPPQQQQQWGQPPQRQQWEEPPQQQQWGQPPQQEWFSGSAQPLGAAAQRRARRPMVWMTVAAILAVLLAGGAVVVGTSSHKASSAPKHPTTPKPGAAIVSKALCDPLPKAAAGTSDGLNGAFDAQQFASSSISIGAVGVKGLGTANFLGGCASTTTGTGYKSDRILFSFVNQPDALKFAAYTFADIVPDLATVGSPSGPDSVKTVAGSLFEFYDTLDGSADIGFAIRGSVAAEVAVAATTFSYDPETSFTADLASMARNLTGRSVQVTLGTTGPDVTGPVRPVVLDSSAPGASVDLDEAATVTRLLWQYRQLALNADDVAALPLIEGGELLAIDRGLCATSCASEQKVGAVVDYSPIVVLQEDWPASFVASVVYSGFCGELCVDTFVAVQQREGAPWRMSLYVAYSGQVSMETSNSGSSSWAQPPAPPSAAPIGTIEGDYARYLQTLQSTGHPPRSSPFAPSFFSDRQTLTSLGIPPDGTDAAGVSRTTTFAGGPVSHDEFAVDFDVTAVCGTYTWTTAVLPPAGEVLSQPADRSTFGGLVRPGSYASISLHGVGMTCFDISPDAGDPIYPVGALDSVVSATGGSR